MADAYEKRGWQGFHDTMMVRMADLLSNDGVVKLKEFIQCCVVLKERLMVDSDPRETPTAIGMAGLSAMLNREGPEQ